MRFLIVTAVFFLFLLQISAGAQSPASASEGATPFSSHNPLMSPEEQKILQKARQRAYAGGSDEESLKVQAQLPVATRKMAPATEAPMDSDAGATPSND